MVDRIAWKINLQNALRKGNKTEWNGYMKHVVEDTMCGQSFQNVINLTFAPYETSFPHL